MNPAVSPECGPTCTIVGLDIGGSKIAVVEHTADAQILQQREISTEAGAGTRVVRGVALLIDAVNPQVIDLGSLAVLLGERGLAPLRAISSRRSWVV
jgi:predicted NBD/HSP70 family sugar kinase